MNGMRILHRQIFQPPTLSSIRSLSTTTTSLSTQNTNTSSSNSQVTANDPRTIDPRWLTMMKRRIGKCLMFGVKPPQVQEAGGLLRRLARDWRELTAGSEGFLTDERRRALFRHNISWGEMDVMTLHVLGHVNNVTYVRYAETARVNLTRNLALHIDPAHKLEWLNLVSSKGIGLILRSIKVDYKFPMKWPDKITVYHKLARDPNSSSLSADSAIEMHVVILSEARQRPAARCYEDNVTYDYKAERKTSALPPFIMKQFKVMWELQEETKRVWRRQAQEIENKVRRLEVESWDREDADEDTGGR